MTTRPTPAQPIDLLQRYTIEESKAYLRLSRPGLYAKIRRGELRIIKDGTRTYVPGSELARVSTLPA